MAKNINHIQHIKSNVVENGLPKLPSSNVLVEGEIAVNFAKDYETLSIKNSSGEVITFSSDNYYSEKKLGSGFTGDNSGNTVTQVINDKSLVIAAALNDLNSRIIEVSGNTPEIDLSDYYNKTEVDGKLGSGFTGENSGNTVTKVIEDNELAISAALNDLNSRKLDASAYTETDLDGYATEEWVFDRLGSGFTGENSGRTVSQVIREDELIIASALTDLDDRKLDASAYTETDLSEVYEAIGDVEDALSSHTLDSNIHVTSEDKVKWNSAISGVSFNGSAATVSNGVASINVLDYFNGAEYNSTDKKIYFKHDGTVISSATIDATDFIKDGMVNDVKVDEPISGENSGSTCLIVTFNTDAGKEDIEIPLTELFDPEEYYTRAQIDTMLGSGFTGVNSGHSVSERFYETELVVAAALNDLNSRKLDASAYTPTDLSDYYTKQEIDDTEEAIAAALNDLNSRKLDASAYTPTDLSGYYTKQEIDEERLGEWFSGVNSANTVTSVMRDNELAIAAALNDLNTRKLDAESLEDRLGSGFTGNKTVTEVIEEDELIIASALNDLNSRIIELSGGSAAGGGAVVWNLTDFDFDGHTFDEIYDQANNTMNDVNVWNIQNNGAAPTGFYRLYAIQDNGPYLAFVATTGMESHVVTFYPDGQNGELIFDDYQSFSMEQIAEFVSTTINNKLGYAFSGESSSSVTDVIKENELIISSAFNDLNSRINELSGRTGNDTYVTAGTYSSSNSSIVLELNDGSDVTISGITGGGGSGGGGDVNVIESVKVNGTALTPDANKAVDITEVPASIVTQDATHRFVSDTEKSTWGGKQDALSNASVLSGITSQKVTNWDNAYTSAHSHSNKSVLDSLTQDVITNSHTHGNLSTLETITSAKMTNWDNAYTSAHSHSNKSVLDGITSGKVSDWDGAVTQAHSHDNSSVLDNLTQAVIDNSHTHTNGTVLDGITTAKTAQWDNAISAVSFNGTDATVTNHKAAITATIPTSLSQLASAHTHAISEVTDLQSTLDAKVSGITVNSGTKVTPTNGVANLTINASTVGALATGTTLDGIADGTTRKLSDYATTGTVNTHSGTTIPSATSSQMHLPAVTAADNGKILMVSGGTWVLVNPTTIYTGTGTPQSSQGNDGDIYLQTS